MKFLTALTLLSPLLQMIALPAGAQSAVPRSVGAPMRLAAASDAATDRDTYARKAHDEVQEWQRKLHEFNAAADTRGKEAGNTAKADLNEAWRKTEIASRKLRRVGAEDWDAAKADYENASHNLADVWRKIQPDHT